MPNAKMVQIICYVKKSELQKIRKARGKRHLISYSGYLRQLVREDIEKLKKL